MEAIRQEIEDLAAEIRRLEEVEDGESIQAAMDIVSEVATDATRLQQEDAYHDWLIDTLNREKDRLDAGERSEPLCTCSDPYCAIKRGKIPAAVRMADSIDRGIRVFKQDHVGDPRVLIDARERWLTKANRTREALRTAVLVIRGELDHDPREDDPAETIEEGDGTSASALSP